MSKFKYTYKDPASFNQKLTIGSANLTVTGAEVKESKKGDPMLVLDLNITDHHGFEKEIKEYILSTEAWMWKLHAFLACIGRSHLYGPGIELDPDMLLGGTGNIILDEKDDEYNGKSFKKVYIKKFLPGLTIDQPKTIKTVIEKDADFDDEIPF